VAEHDSGPRAEFGVLFVGGIGKQRPGRTLVSFAAALYDWLFRWNRAGSVSVPEAPVLSATTLAPGDDPAHATLSFPLSTEDGHRRAEWLLAESSWADVWDLPRFMDVARWIWKVSTCLLVLQFIIPMRRHWKAAARARRDKNAIGRPHGEPLRQFEEVDGDHGWVPSSGAVAAYLILMGIAATLSVLLSILLVALALAALLPIPRIDQAVHWAIVRLSSVLGDSYLLAHCPVELAAMRTRVAADLRWLQARCETVAVVAHSQGAAIAHEVLKGGEQDPAYPVSEVAAFVTVGQGIAKLHLLQRLDWNPGTRVRAMFSRLFVSGGLVLAGLPTLGLLVGHRAGVPALAALDSLPAWGILAAGGFGCIGLGVHHAIRTADADLPNDACLPAAASTLIWTDYYASADPVSNGQLLRSLDGRTDGAEPGRAADGRSMLPFYCREIYNHGSLLTDHNSYLRNQSQLLSAVMNDLVAAAYGGDSRTPLVRDDALDQATWYRKRLVDGLIVARVLAAVLGAAVWQLAPAASVQDAVNRLIQASGAHLAVGRLAARLLATGAVTGVAYLLFGILLWQALERLSTWLWFRRPRPARQASGLAHSGRDAPGEGAPAGVPIAAARRRAAG
jgi:hypothetical protein